MGNIASLSSSLLPEFNRPVWLSDLRAAKRLIARFEKVQNEFGYGITFDTFKRLYRPQANVSGGDGSDGSINGGVVVITDSDFQSVWDLWDPLHKGKTDVLQIFAGTILCCSGRYDEKVSLLFQIFDMDMNDSITRDEMIIAIRASLCGFSRMVGIEPPEPSELNEIARLAFRSADRQQQKDNKIQHSELILWSHVTQECIDIVGRFNTIDIHEIRRNYTGAGGGGGGGGGGVRKNMSSTDENQRRGKTTSHTLPHLIDESAARERELMRSKPAIPTVRELTLAERHAKLMREEGRHEAGKVGSPSYNRRRPKPPQTTSVEDSSTSAAASSSSSSSSSRWHKKLDDLIFLRQCFEACEIIGNDAQQHGTEVNASHTARRGGGVTPAAASPSRPSKVSTHPGTGVAHLVVFGTHMKSQGGKWRKLPSFRTLDGPIQSGQTITLRDVFRSYYPELTIHKNDLDDMIQASQKRFEIRHDSEIRKTNTMTTMMVDGNSNINNSSENDPHHTNPYVASPSSHPQQPHMSPPADSTPSAAVSSSPPPPTHDPTPSSSSSPSSPPPPLPSSSSSLPPPKSIPRSLILKIQTLYNKHDSIKMEGRLPLMTLIDILKTSKKLKEFISLRDICQSEEKEYQAALSANASESVPTLPPLTASSPSSDPSSLPSPSSSSSPSTSPLDRLVTLPELLTFLFRRSHSFELPTLLSYVTDLPPLTDLQRHELQTLFNLYDTEGRNRISLQELKDGLTKQFPNEKVSSFETLLSEVASGSKGDRVDWNGFQRLYRSIWVKIGRG